MKVWAVILSCAMAFSSPEAWAAKRLGGGTSIGKQSTNVTQRSSSAPAPQPATTPSQATGAPGAVASQPSAAAQAAAPKRPWGAMLGGLAAGLGLAWLASSLGLGEGFAQLLLVLLAVGVVLMVVAALRRRTSGVQAAQQPFAFQAAGGSSLPRDYSPKNVGNDASARPWEHGNSTFGNADGESLIGSALAGSQAWGVPADFDSEGFLRASKANFIKLQDAWDRADIPALRAMMTDEMISQIQAQLSEREKHTGSTENKTDVVMLEAQLLGIEELPGEYMASVEFSGMIREEPSAGPNPFREVWNITRPKTGQGGWLVAGVQALQ